MIRVESLEITALGMLENLQPMALPAPVAAIRGGPASGRSTVLRALALLGTPPDGEGPDPLRDYPAWSYLRMREAAAAGKSTAVVATVTDEAGERREIRRRHRPGEGEGEALRVRRINAVEWHAPVLPAPEPPLVPDERRILLEHTAQGYAEDLTRVLGIPVGAVLEDDPGGGPPSVRLRERGTAYSVGMDQLGSSLAGLLRLVALSRLVAEDPASLVLIDDLGAGLHPDLGPGVVSLLSEHLGARHHLVYVPVSDAFAPLGEDVSVHVDRVTRGPPDRQWWHPDAGAASAASAGAPDPGATAPEPEGDEPAPPASVPSDGEPAASAPPPPAPEAPELEPSGPEAPEPEAGGPGLPEPEASAPPATPSDPAEDGEDEETRGLLAEFDRETLKTVESDAGEGEPEPDAPIRALLGAAATGAPGATPEDEVSPARYARAFFRVTDLPWSPEELDPRKGIVASIEDAYGPYDREAVARAVGEEQNDQ